MLLLQQFARYIQTCGKSQWISSCNLNKLPSLKRGILSGGSFEVHFVFSKLQSKFSSDLLVCDSSLYIITQNLEALGRRCKLFLLCNI